MKDEYDFSNAVPMRSAEELRQIAMKLQTQADELVEALKKIEQRAADNLDDRETVYAIHKIARQALNKHKKTPPKRG